MARLPICLRISLVLAGACLVGCSQSAKEEPAKSDASAEAADEQASIDKALASLSAEDRKLAIAQQTCPVGGGRLGSMGTPHMVEVKGRKLFLCCEHCEKPLLEDPDKYLALLDKTASAQ